MNNQTVSVVVAIYNCKKYLYRCLDSIVNQTYRDLQIILVDDGSTDGSAEICDEYEKKDSRIIVIHKENEGLSVARNTALTVANGEYLSFIDSDDILKNTLYEIAISLMSEEGSEIVKYDYCIEQDYLNQSITSDSNTISAYEAMHLILKDEYGSQLWQYLFKRNLWDNIISPKGRLAQDMMTLHLAVAKATKMTIINEPLYYYYQDNTNNVSNSNRKSIRGTADRAFAYWLRVEFCDNNSMYSSDIPFCLLKAVSYSISCFCRKEFFVQERYQDDRKMFRKKIKKSIIKIMQNHELSIKRKICSLLIIIAPKSVPQIFTVGEKKN